MKNFFVILSVCFGFFVNAQTALTEVLLVKKTGDSVSAKMDLGMISFSGRSLMETEKFYRKLNVLDSDGKKIEVVRPDEIRELSFTNFQGEKVRYIQDYPKNQLMRVLYEGKYKCYAQYLMVCTWCSLSVSSRRWYSCQSWNV